MKKSHNLVVIGFCLMLGMTGCSTDQPATASKPAENEVAEGKPGRAWQVFGYHSGLQRLSYALD